MAENDKYADEMLTDDELDGVAGGTFTPNKLSRVTYEVAGIKIVDHFFAKDEFWYKGENIGHDKATAVGLYFKYNKKLPETADDAVHWYENDYKAPKNVHVVKFS